MAVVEREDATALEQWDLDARTYRRSEAGVVVDQRPFSDAEARWADRMDTENIRRGNADQIAARARTAYSNNAAYLALVAAGTATNADHIGQVPRLTRQMQEVIRWIVQGDLLDTQTDQPKGP
jgi:hypothetical protein